MASTATQSTKDQEKTQQSGTTRSGSSQTGTAKGASTPQGGSQGTGTSQQPAGGTPGTSQTGQAGQSQPGQQGQQGETGGALSRTSGQGQGLARRGSFGSLYFPSTAEFFSNPWGVMRRMHEDMDRAFAEVFSGGTGGGAGTQATWAPAIDVSEREGNLVVHAELAGVKPEDVQLEVDNDTLILSGRRDRSEEHEEKGVHRRERVFGSFYRAIPLPEGTDTEKVRAQFNNGVLEVTIPLPPQRQAQARRIPIGTGKS